MDFIQQLAQKAASIAGVPWQWVYSQWQYESANFTSWQAVNYNNYAGLMNSAGSPLSFSTPEEFADYYGRYLTLYNENGQHLAQDANSWLDSLSNGGYFTGNFPGGDNENNKYYDGFNSYLAQLPTSSIGAAAATAAAPNMFQKFINAATNLTAPAAFGFVKDPATSKDPGVMDKVQTLALRIIKILVGLALFLFGIVLLTKDNLVIEKEASS